MEKNWQLNEPNPSGVPSWRLNVPAVPASDMPSPDDAFETWWFKYIQNNTWLGGKEDYKKVAEAAWQASHF